MKVADGASGEEEPSDEICEIVDVPASFKSGVWTLFGFPTSGNKKRRKEKDQKTVCNHSFTMTITHQRHFAITVKVKLFNEC